jgi:hypothetical protein
MALPVFIVIDLRSLTIFIGSGVPGLEPGLSVLETDVLTIDTIPLQEGMRAEG